MSAGLASDFKDLMQMHVVLCLLLSLLDPDGKLGEKLEQVTLQTVGRGFEDEC